MNRLNILNDFAFQKVLGEKGDKEKRPQGRYSEKSARPGANESPGIKKM